MLHNPPYPLDRTIVTERKFEDILRGTYSQLDGLENKLREHLVDAIERFASDPADATQWRVESAVANQTTLSIVVEIRALINGSESLEAVKDSFQSFVTRYRQQIIAWANAGESSSSAISNVASRITLAATAKEFGSWGLANDIERAIDNDIEETKKRVVVTEFIDLKVDEHFRLSPDTSTQLYRKLSPRKAVKSVYPATKADQQLIDKHETVYLFRVPLETDKIYNDEVLAA